MQHWIENAIEAVNGFVWGIPALILIVGTGLYLSFGTGFVQLRQLGRALRSVLGKFFGKSGKEEGQVSPFQAVCTALAATVGTGNIAGVAGALALGGPGAIFWMWIAAFLGMAIKYAEVVLAVRFRQSDGQGGYVGGPMYFICNGLGKKWQPLAVAYCIFGVIAAFGVGNTTQVNAVVSSINSALAFFDCAAPESRNFIIGAVMAALVAVVLLGGVKRIGAVAEFLVPFMSISYILLCFGVFIVHFRQIPAAFSAIFQGAFSPRACTGGLIGSAFLVLRTGVSRGTFTNEAGMGTASIAHAAADTPHPAEQGLFGIFEVFADTIVICTMTALVILCSGVPIPYGVEAGAELTSSAFVETYGGWVTIFIAIALVCFAFATILGWGLYGMRCAAFLFGSRSTRFFAVIHAATCIWGAVASPTLVWQLAEMVNGLMSIPNLLAVWLLCPVVFRLTKEWFGKNNR